MEATKLSLRILYTINSTPQYILARSPSPVLVTPIPVSSSTTNYHYATVSLKTCLDTICCSSPELVQDTSRDYSVYVLDPLEASPAPAPVSIITDPSSSKASCAAPEPRGVAVGLGLMSWALRADERDGCTVNGTLIKLGTGQTALEVIFALRETASIQKSSFPAALRSWGLPPQPSIPAQRPTPGASGASSRTGNATTTDTQANAVHQSSSSSAASSSSRARPLAPDGATLATITSIQMRTQQRRLKPKPVKPPASPPKSEADRLMLAQGVYIGPVKKKGRPAKVVNTPIGVTGQTAPKNAAVPLDPKSQPPEPQKDSSAPAQSAPHDPTNILDVLAYISATSPSGDPNAAILTAFSAIDSSANPGSPSPALVTALKDLLAAIAQQQSTPSANEAQVPTPHISAKRKNSTSDEEVVILDKENVNPRAFRRRGEKDEKPHDIHASPVRNGLGLASLSNTLSTSHSHTNPSTNTTIPGPKTPSKPSRKRTLSDFMDEKEAERNNGKGRENDKRHRRSSLRHDHSSRPSLSDLSRRHYPRVVAADYAQKRAGTNSYYRTGMEPWTSPVKPPPPVSYTWTPSTSSTQSHDENSREKPIVIPDSPRASRNVASSPGRYKMDPPRRRYVVPEWARTETTTQPRLSEEAQRALEERVERQKEERERKRRENRTIEKRKPVAEPQTTLTITPREQVGSGKVVRVSNVANPPKPIAAAADGGLIFPTVTSTENQALPTPSTPTRQNRLLPWSVPAHTSVPCTPPKKHSGNLFSPEGGSSLFTPLPNAQGRTMDDHTTSPFHRRLLNYLSGETDDPKSTENDGDAEDDLDRELDSALEELDLPPSSVPTADGGGRDDTNEETAQRPAKERWIGLPPSSPPPPSSPLLLPQDDDSDVEDGELPVATSEAGDYPADIDDTFPPSSPTLQSTSPGWTEEEIAEFFSGPQKLAPLFPDLCQSQSTSESDPLGSGIDIFGQAHGHDIQQPGLGEMTPGTLQPDLQDSDLDELWEILKPLMEQKATKDSQDSVSSNDLGFDFGQLEDGQGTVDPTKLAVDIQTLFSGCLV